MSRNVILTGHEVFETLKNALRLDVVCIVCVQRSFVYVCVEREDECTLGMV